MQAGSSLGFLLATAMTSAVSSIVGGDAFAEWSWRIPFVASFVIVGIGLIIRTRVEESAVFTERVAADESTEVASATEPTS